MTWFKVDDSFYDHPKIFDAPDSALALWVRAGSWSARNLTDGFVPATLPARLCDDPDTAVRALVDRGLWKRTRGGYQFHDWAEYQPSAADVKDLRQKRAEAGRKGGRAKAARVGRDVPDTSHSGKVDRFVTSDGLETEDGSVSQTYGETPGQAKAAKQTASKAVANARDVAKQNAAPTRPDPSRRDGGSVGGSSTGSRRAREDDEIDQGIARQLEQLTGKPIALDWATKVRAGILAGRDPDDPRAYIAAAIRGNPHRYLPTADEHPSSRTVAQAIADSLGRPR